MKYLLPFAFAIIALVSCKKEEPKPVVEIPTPRTNFHATISNKPWDSEVSAAAEDGGRLKISGTPVDGTILEIDLNGIAQGTYEINDSSASTIRFSTDSADYTSTGNKSLTGKVIVTKNAGGQVSGTFDVTLVNSLTGRMLTIEDGVFTDVAFGTLPKAFTGDTLYMGWLNMGTKKGLYYVLQNQTTGALAYRKILGSSQFNGALNSCKSDKGNYLSFPEKGVGGYFSIPDHEQISLFVADSFHSAVVVKDKFYYQIPKSGIFELNPVAGSSTKLHQDFGLAYSSLATDGTAIYSFNGAKFKKIAVATGLATDYTFVDGGTYLALEYLTTNTFLTVKSVQIGGITKYQLLKLEIVGTDIVSTLICDIKQDNSASKKACFAFDRTTGKFFASFPKTGTTFYQVSEVNVAAATVKTHVVEGELNGVEPVH